MDASHIKKTVGKTKMDVIVRLRINTSLNTEYVPHGLSFTNAVGHTAFGCTHPKLDSQNPFSIQNFLAILANILLSLFVCMSMYEYDPVLSLLW